MSASRADETDYLLRPRGAKKTRAFPTLPTIGAAVVVSLAAVAVLGRGAIGHGAAAKLGLGNATSAPAGSGAAILAAPAPSSAPAPSPEYAPSPEPNASPWKTHAESTVVVGEDGHATEMHEESDANGDDASAMPPTSAAFDSVDDAAAQLTNHILAHHRGHSGSEHYPGTMGCELLCEGANVTKEMCEAPDRFACEWEVEDGRGACWSAVGGDPCPASAEAMNAAFANEPRANASYSPVVRAIGAMEREFRDEMKHATESFEHVADDMMHNFASAEAVAANATARIAGPDPSVVRARAEAFLEKFKAEHGRLPTKDEMHDIVHDIVDAVKGDPADVASAVSNATAATVAIDPTDASAVSDTTPGTTMDTTPDSTMDTMPGTTMDSMPGTTMSDAGEDPALGYEAAEAGAGAVVDKRVHDGVHAILEPDMERVRAEAKHLYEMDRAVTKMVDGIVQEERKKMDEELTMTIKKDHHALAERIKKKAAQMEQEANELEQSSMLTPTSDSEPTTMDTVPGSTMDSMPGTTMDSMPGSTMDSMQGTTMDSMPVSTMDSMNDDDHDDDHKPLAEHSSEPPLNYNVGDLPEGFPKAMAEHVGIQDGVALIENCGVPQDIVDFLNKTDSNIEKLDEYFNNHPHYGTFDIAAMLKEMETTWKEHGVCHLDDDDHYKYDPTGQIPKPDDPAQAAALREHILHTGDIPS